MSAETPPIKLYTALLAAMREFGAVKKDRQNPAFRSSYATLNSILEAVEGPLNDHGLILIQRFSHDANYAVLLTELIHAESGECITSTVPIACAEPNNPQKVGGAITYYRRYSLLTLLNLTPEEDDDGNSASQPPRRDQRPAEPFNGFNGTANRPAPAPRPTPAGQDGPVAQPLPTVLAKLRQLDQEKATWPSMKVYADAQWDLADPEGQEAINAEMKAIAARRRGGVALVAPASNAG